MGAAASPDMLGVFEKTIRDNAGSPTAAPSVRGGGRRGQGRARTTRTPATCEYVKRSLDLERLKAADMHVLVEPMWGAGAGWIPRLLAGGKIRVTEIHSERNPWFGGVNPEPIAPNIDECTRHPGEGGYDLGLLLDGDADRAGAADEKGTFIHQLEVMGLLMYYLLEYRGLRAAGRHRPSTRPRWCFGSARSTACRSTRRRSASSSSGPKMIETGAMMGGEESGGYGFGMHLPERDGIYADLLLLDLFIHENASTAVARLEGGRAPPRDRRASRSTCGVDVHATARSYPALKERLLRELRDEGARVAGRPAGRPDTARSTRTTASSSGSPTARGSWCASAARNRWCASTRRRPRRTRPTRSSGRASSWSAARDRPGSSGAPGRRAGDRCPTGREAVGPRARSGPTPTAMPARSSSSRRAGGCRSSTTSASSNRSWWSRAACGSISMRATARFGRAELGPGGSALIPVGRRHRFEAIERVELIEVSSPELDDVVRVEDDFGREGTVEP